MTAADRTKRLLRLHDELDQLSDGWTARGVIRASVLTLIAAVVGLRIVQIGFDAGVAVEIVLVLLVSGGVLGGIQLWKGARIRDLRERIEAAERKEIP